jgi:ribonuclease P protein component
MASPAERPWRSGRLQRSERLRQSRDFQRVGRTGTRVASRDFVLLVAPCAGGAVVLPCRRLGVTASRKVGPAVVRNRIKRGIREWFRHHRGELAEDVDVVVIARRSAAALPAEGITKELRALARRSSEKRSGKRESSKSGVPNA